MTECDIAVVGAGPYGLSAAAHLRAVRGLDVRIFGDPMSFWRDSMPAGMFLRSNWTATQIADPGLSLTIEDYQTASGNQFSAPVPIESFIDYGLWYQCTALPDLERRKVARIDRADRGFRLTLEDGDALISRRVVIASGLNGFASRPAEFKNLPASLVTHTSEHREFKEFVGRHVLVVGGGQSALESAALLHESGAQVEVIARCPRIHWLGGLASTTLHHRLGKAASNLIYASTDVGPAGISQLMARPDLLRRFPRLLQDILAKRSIRPAGARWLVDRLREVQIRLNRAVVLATRSGDRVKVRLDDGTEGSFDHVVLGTGYRVDISKYSFLAPNLIESIRHFNAYPCLTSGLESSVPGLHFLGAPAAWSFGPLMRFVSGTRYASLSLVRYIGGKT